MDWQSIDGWLCSDEGTELQRLAADATVLEIGTLFGRSTICMAAVAKLVVAVDPHNGMTLEGTQWYQQSSLDQFFANLTKAGCRNVVPVVAEIQNTANVLASCFDLVFVDGDHSEQACWRDLVIAAGCLRSARGTIVVHDYYSGYDKHDGVIRAVNRFAQDRPIRRVHSLAILENWD